MSNPLVNKSYALPEPTFSEEHTSINNYQCTCLCGCVQRYPIAASKCPDCVKDCPSKCTGCKKYITRDYNDGLCLECSLNTH